MGVVVIVNLEETFNRLNSIEIKDEIHIKLMIAIQSLEFINKNTIIAVTSRPDVTTIMKHCEDIMIELEYDYQIIPPNRIKLKNKQPYIMVESVLDKYTNGCGHFQFSSLI